ncbi:MAG: hypothetical protein AB1531_05360, partial [Chloroflexota bacterium]
MPKTIKSINEKQATTRKTDEESKNLFFKLISWLFTGISIGFILGAISIVILIRNGVWPTKLVIPGMEFE